MLLDINHLQTADYTYVLPEERIAKYPLPERDRSKLLVFRNGTISGDIFAHLSEYIDRDDMLVFNNTRVIRARIEMEKETGARIEIFCLEPHDPSDYPSAFARRETCQWKCLVGNLKKWKSGTLTKTIAAGRQTIVLSARNMGDGIVRFCWSGDMDFGALLELMGQIPVPPYLNRRAEPSDDTRYQTVYSKHRGSVAAPTAGLHFSQRLMRALTAKGVALEEITLHVGAGTFRPMRHGMVKAHEMHVERFSVRLDLIRRLLAAKGCPTAVGTTSLRALESMYWLGVKLLHPPAADSGRMELKQWEDCRLPQSVSLHDALTTLAATLETSGQETLQASTQIMIVPGYAFRVCRRLITNFHQPQSTLLLLVGAFAGEKWKEIYRYALDNDYRFLSYGDSSLLELAGNPP
ncbi:MAG: S-adenosylmethionine:tRNA ribosyltransferase-isomerase [Bacteroidales bacterium]|nr:S-adenosylmethionine:tRNA ribosyltransferase-isomerase [Bacteroidales bacterium]